MCSCSRLSRRLAAVVLAGLVYKVDKLIFALAVVTWGSSPADLGLPIRFEIVGACGVWCSVEAVMFFTSWWTT